MLFTRETNYDTQINSSRRRCDRTAIVIGYFLKRAFSLDRQSIQVAVAGFHWIIYRRHFMLCFGVLILIGSFHICRGVRRLPASLSGRRSFVVKMPRPHGNCKFRKRCESQPPENMPWESHDMCDRLNTKRPSLVQRDVNGPRVVLWLTCWRRKVE